MKHLKAHKKETSNVDWPSILFIILMYCVVMLAAQGMVMAAWSAMAFGGVAKLPMFLAAYLPGMLTFAALRGGLIATAAHLIIRRFTKSRLLTVLAVTVVATIAELFLIRGYVQSTSGLLTQAFIFTPFVGTMCLLIVWREGRASKNRLRPMEE